MAINYFPISITRRLSISLLAVAGSLLFAALDLIGSGISANERVYAAKISESVFPLASSALAGMFALIFAEIGAHPTTPSEGHPRSKGNYLQSAFALLVVMGFGNLVFGGFKLISAAIIQQ